MKRPSTNMLLFALSLGLFIGLIGCTSEPRHHGYRTHQHNAVQRAYRMGTVSDIELLTVESRPSGGGAVLGAVIGGVIGHQMGSGRGNDVATGAGVIGGAVAGNQIEKRNGNDSEIYRITVRLDNGAKQEFDYVDLNGLRVGDRVRVEHDQIMQL